VTSEHSKRYFVTLLLAVLGGLSLFGCQSADTSGPASHLLADPSARKGDEIVAAGKMFHIGAPVVLWTDPGGYAASAKNFGKRDQVLSQGEITQVQQAGGKWPLPLLQDRIDQFVLHYDVAGVSQVCFKVLESRSLSVHFMLDVDGTIYQTCDLQARTFHATKSNPRSVGIEIANMGAYTNTVPLKEWYSKDASGHTRLTIPPRLSGGGVRNKSIVLRPARDEMIVGQVHGKTYRQYDLTPQQYDSLAKLTAALATVFPKITLDYPRETGGGLITTDLSVDQYRAYTGVLGHYHVQHDKQDPGPAFQWDWLIRHARSLMSEEALQRNQEMKGKAVLVRSQ
jgi:N-acetyl-anhydromuramyl-L-alanine amidase AmpD